MKAKKIFIGIRGFWIGIQQIQNSQLSIPNMVRGGGTRFGLQSLFFRLTISLKNFTGGSSNAKFCYY
jgi:hypothetical protein